MVSALASRASVLGSIPGGVKIFSVCIGIANEGQKMWEVTQALGAFDDNGLSTAQKFPCVSNDAVQEILDNMCYGDRGQSSQLTAN